MKLMGFAILSLFICSPLLAASPCESLTGLNLSNAAVTIASVVAAGAFVVPAAPRGRSAVATPQAAADPSPGDNPTPAVARGGRGGNPYAKLSAFCRVAATLKPTSDSDIKIEVWLPVSGWNNKLLSVGNGAWAGSISYNDMASHISDGYAVASTDTGHTGGSASFVVDHPEKVIDFSYRAIHEMTVAAKSIIAAYYGSGQKLAYFSGCSTGGRQAITEAQRYPLDYDGIIAGASAINNSRLHATQIWFAEQDHRDEASLIPDNKFAAIHEAVLKACDELDGVKDRVLNNPRQCKFDPKTLLCKDGDSATCLTAAQVETVKRIYAGPGMFPGYEIGSEGSWGGRGGALTTPVGIAYDQYRYFVFNNPSWDYKTLNIGKDIAAFDKVMGSTMNSSDSNLKPFFDHGGKLLMYHGWADPGIPPGNSVQYYSDVVKKTGGAAKVSNSIRLFMLPGVGHCGGGDGPSTFDSAGALDQWRDGGKAPDSILASHSTNGAIDKTRPLCPYPQVGKYKGSGDTNDAANFVCKQP